MVKNYTLLCLKSGVFPLLPPVLKFEDYYKKIRKNNKLPQLSPVYIYNIIRIQDYHFQHHKQIKN